ncbi:hypothetical protein [Deinococcus apachensis]|uniref:hypothetical protein n=1 Tax=Deinococcus apachensis TaxID=309886 RepID=UPI0003725212|nr:hypothetical protein [Deinococcus apachensis]
MREFHQVLHEWETFYLLTGTAGAALAGLMFVALTVVQQTQPVHRLRMSVTRADSDPALLAFVLSLMLSALLLMPSLTRTGFGLLLLAVGLTGLLYSGAVLRQLLAEGRTDVWDLPDRMWYGAAPSLSGVLLLVSGGLGLEGQDEAALTVVAAALLVLLAMGIRNAWDMVTFSIARNAREASAAGQDSTPPA